MVIWLNLRLHHRSTKMGVEERAAWPCGLVSRRESPDYRLGPVCGPKIELQIAENKDRKEIRVGVWARIGKRVVRL